MDRASDEPSEGNGNGSGASHGASQGSVAPQAASEVLESAKTDGAPLLNASAALSQGVSKDYERAVDVEAGEAQWCPYDISLDVAEFVQPSEQGRAYDQQAANAMLEQVKRPIATLRSKFRSLLRAREMTDRDHGLPRGRGLSERMLVDTYVDITEGRFPRRAYYDEDVAQDNSVVAVVSRDQSSSTRKIKKLLDQVMMAVTEPIEHVGGQVMVFGWRVGQRSAVSDRKASEAGYHRAFGVQYDVLKTFGERFANVKWRFVNTVALGGTPMADGIEYGLMALSKRPEAHRILFMITDGRPPKVILPVIRNQLRRAREAGVHVLAVATGNDSCPYPTRLHPNPKPYVAEINGTPLFEHWVYERNPKDLPRPLLRILTKIIDRSETKRGRHVRS